MASILSLKPCKIHHNVLRWPISMGAFMKKRLFIWITKIVSFVLMMCVALKAQASGATVVSGGSTPSPTPTPPVVAQFTSLADQHYKNDSSKQMVTVAGCAASSLDYSSLNNTLFLNLYHDHTFVLGIDDTPTDSHIFAFPADSNAANQRTILTGIWAPINSSHTKFRLNPDGDLAIPSGGWRYITNWISKYACSSTSQKFFVGFGAGSFKVITADINTKSMTMVAGTPVPVGAATLSLSFEGYASVGTGAPTNTPTPTLTTTPTPTSPPASSTPTPTLAPSLTPTPTATITPFGATPAWTPTPTKSYTPTPSGATPTPSPTKRPTMTPAPTKTATPTPLIWDADKKVTYKLTARGAWRPTFSPSPTPVNNSGIRSSATFVSGSGIYIDTQTDTPPP